MNEFRIGDVVKINLAPPTSPYLYTVYKIHSSGLICIEPDDKWQIGEVGWWPYRLELIERPLRCNCSPNNKFKAECLDCIPALYP